MIDQFEKHGISNYEFVVEHDREKLLKSDIDKFKNINLSEISLFMKHVSTFERVSVNNDTVYIVFEDDSIFSENFNERLTKYIDELQKYDWDIVFCGDCCNLHAQNMVPGKYIYKSNTTRGMGMYIVNKGSSKKLKNIFDMEHIICKSIDHWLNDMHDKYGLKYLWIEPTLVQQGSETGLFKSCLDLVEPRFRG